jgi:hypothetical protein
MSGTQERGNLRHEATSKLAPPPLGSNNAERRLHFTARGVS